MNLYEVTYKRFDENQKVFVVATTTLKAIVGAQVVMRSRYHGSAEILTVDKLRSIDRVER